MTNQSAVVDIATPGEQARAVAEARDVIGRVRDTRDLNDDTRFNLAVKIVKASGVLERHAEYRADDRRASGRHPGGRPAYVSHEAILVLWIYLALDHSPLLVARMTDVVMSRLMPTQRERIGLPSNPAASGEWHHWYDRIHESLHSFLNVIEPYGTGPDGRRRGDLDAYEMFCGERDPRIVEERLRRAHWVANRLIEASVQLTPAHIRQRFDGNIAFDATVVPAFGKGRNRPRGLAGLDASAGYYDRDTIDHSPTDDPRGSKRRTTVWGREATVVSMLPNDLDAGADERLFPLLVTGISLHNPGVDIAGNAVSALVSMAERGYPTGYAIADRAYVPGQKFESFHEPVRALGYRFVADYRDDQLGVQGGQHGAIAVEGNYYCPAMPQRLIDATRDYRVEKKIDEPQWRDLIAQRDNYRLSPKGKPDADGYQRMRCQAALGDRSPVACPVKKELGLVETYPPGAIPLHISPVDRARTNDRVCTQMSVTMAPTPDLAGKLMQDVAFGSKKWQRAYGMRNTIEGVNGLLKSGQHEALADPARRRVRGYAATILSVAALTVSLNVRKTREFLNELAQDRSIAPARRSRQRRRKYGWTNRYGSKNPTVIGEDDALTPPGGPPKVPRTAPA